MEEHIEVEGRILTVLAGTMFRVELDNKHQVLATISGKMRKKFVRLTVGDRVKMEMSPYDLNKARITWRLRELGRVHEAFPRDSQGMDVLFTVASQLSEMPKANQPAALFIPQSKPQ